MHRLDRSMRCGTVIARHTVDVEGVAEARVLNRVIRVVPTGWEYECDQSHAQIIIEELQLQDARPAVTPGVDDLAKRTVEEVAAGSQELEPAAAT